MVERRRRARPRALCADERGGERRRSTSQLVAPRRAPATVVLVHAGVALAMLRRAARMKFVDEFRDAELGRRAGRARSSPPSSPAATTRSWRSAAGTRTRSTSTASTTCCRPTSSSSTGPGCPVCVIPMGRVDDGIAIAHEPGRDLHLLRRHAARARRRRHAAGRQGRRAPTCGWSTRRSTRCASRARTPTARSSSSRSASRRRRRRPR